MGGLPAGAALDLNSNGMSDIWEEAVNGATLPPGEDADGDGAANREESVAGTDPLDFSSNLRIAWVSREGGEIWVTVPGARGKRYELESSDAATGAVWTVESGQTLDTGDYVVLRAGGAGAGKFFRVSVSDVDTDGDGLADWEEYAAGLDPNNPTSRWELDENGQPLTDFEYAAARAGSRNIVEIVADDAAAWQPEPGQNASNPGILTVRRGGFGFREVTVTLEPASTGEGSAVEGVDFAAVPRSVTLGPGELGRAVPIVPLANTNRAIAGLATLRLSPGTGYGLGATTNATVVIYPSSTPKGLGLLGTYYTNASSTYTSTRNFDPANIRLTRLDAGIDFSFNTTNPIPNAGYFGVRWTGQVQPQYSERYFFVPRTDDGVKLWVNDQLIIDSWVSRGSPTETTGSIELVADVRYNIRMEYYVTSGTGAARLSWYSASQPKQVIPANRLYPGDGADAASAVTDATEAHGFLGQPFSHALAGANSPGAITAWPVPPGLAYDSTNGTLHGVPTLAGVYQVLVAASNASGTGAGVLKVIIFETPSALSREVWTNAPGSEVADIPLDRPADRVEALGGMESPGEPGGDYAERIRGYLRAPVTGNYYFWVAASGSAELWVANDGEPNTRVRRARASQTAPRDWLGNEAQRTPWLALEGGRNYYVEVLHKSAAGPGHLSVGWRQDDTGTNRTPADIVPAHLLTRHFQVPPSYLPGTLYTATLLAQPGAVTHGVGSATLRLNAAGTEAELKFTSSGLTGPITSQHIHADPYLNHPGQIIFDIDDEAPGPDGERVWHIIPVGTLSAADVLEVLTQGKAYINLHTANYPGGEIKGYFNLASGTQVFTPPPAAPAWADDHSNSNAASRFLIQASFGPTLEEIDRVRQLGYEAWIDDQFAQAPSRHLPYVLANANYDPTRPYPGTLTFNAWWSNSISGPDQLRQRVAFALSEIFVVSEYGVNEDRATALSSYYDTLLEHAFGNFREILEAVTLHPAMGRYLDMRANQKGDIRTGRHPNENYAREILQLFSVGLYRMWPDGTLVLNSADSIVPTYDQEEVLGYSRVFTGWNYHQTNQANGRLPTSFSPPSDYINPMVLVPTRHELGTKRLLDNVVLPQAWGAEASSANPEYDAYGLRDLELAMDSIANHENAGPFICRQLIQRLVTSHPTRDYLYRVVQAFNDNGSGARGDMRAVIKAILLDYEARTPSLASHPGYGKQREPVLRVTAAARAFQAPSPVDGTFTQAGDRAITCSLPVAHRLNNGYSVLLAFDGENAPVFGRYSVTLTSPTAFTVNDPNLLAGSYTQVPNTAVSNALTGQTVTTNAIFVNISSHGLAPGRSAWLEFTSGGGPSGPFEVVLATNANNFVVLTPDASARTGNARLPRITGGYTQSSNVVTIRLTGNHGLASGDPVYIDFRSGSAPDGLYTVDTAQTATRFTVAVPSTASQTQPSLTVFPLAAPALSRSGSVRVHYNSWNVGSTSGSLGQTALRSPTVFNFFSPDYKYPGSLAAAGLTTPEFQLTSDTEVASQMNFLASAVLGTTGNTNGLSSFTSGDGDISLDLGRWMTPALTTDAAGVGALVDAFNTLLCGGQLSTAARDAIVAYASSTANFPMSTPPTFTQMRNRVRAVAHLVLVSPDFTIQR